MADLASTRVFGKLTVMHEAIVKANAEIEGNITASKFIGDGSQLTALPWGQLTGVPASATRWPAWGDVTGKPTTYAPSGHTHPLAEVTGLTTELADKAATSTQVIAGTGLTGGGTLAANRTLTVSYGTTAGTAAQGNDSRITGALQASQVEQTPGTSTTNVMSQKATTDAIDTAVQTVETPIGYGVSNNSTLTMFTDSQGRKFLKSGYVLPLEQVPDATSDMISKQVDWTSLTIPGGNYGSVASKGNLLVAVKSGIASSCATSTDGITWTSRTIPIGSYRSVIASGNLFVAVGTNVCATSPDGITWTSRTIPTGSYTSVTYGDGLFVAVGEKQVCATSPDGITWTSRTIPTGSYRSVTFNDGLFVAVGGNICATSPDGITWTSRTIPTGSYTSVTYGDGLFVAVGGNICATSPDGITWTSRTIPTGSYTSVTYGDGLLVAVGGGKTYVTSPDGITWTERTFPTGSYVSVTSYNGLFVAVGSNGVCATSPDGITWTERTFPTGSYVSVTSYNGLFVAVGSNGVCATGTVSLVVGFENYVHYLYMRIL